jgi:hypothetical protein
MIEGINSISPGLEEAGGIEHNGELHAHMISLQVVANFSDSV